MKLNQAKSSKNVKEKKRNEVFILNRKKLVLNKRPNEIILEYSILTQLFYPFHMLYERLSQKHIEPGPDRLQKAWSQRQKARLMRVNINFYVYEYRTVVQLSNCNPSASANASARTDCVRCAIVTNARTASEAGRITLVSSICVLVQNKCDVYVNLIRISIQKLTLRFC